MSGPARSTSPVVVGVDGSHASRLALAHGLHEANRAGSGLVAVHAWQPHVWVEGMPGPGLSAQTTLAADSRQARDLVEREVAAALDALPDPNATRVRAQAVEGHAGRVLVNTGREARLLVLGRSGHHGLAGVLLGSTVRYALHHSQVPVLVLPDPGPPPGHLRRVVVGYDGPPSDAALAWALARARRDALEVVVLHAWRLPHPPVPALSAVTTLTNGLQEWLHASVDPQLPADDELAVRVEALNGSPTATLLDEAGRDDLLVVGARGRGGFPRLSLGSVPLQLTEHAACPVAVVR